MPPKSRTFSSSRTLEEPGPQRYVKNGPKTLHIAKNAVVLHTSGVQETQRGSMY